MFLLWFSVGASKLNSVCRTFSSQSNPVVRAHQQGVVTWLTTREPRSFRKYWGDKLLRSVYFKGFCLLADGVDTRVLFLSRSEDRSRRSYLSLSVFLLQKHEAFSSVLAMQVKIRVAHYNYVAKYRAGMQRKKWVVKTNVLPFERTKGC